jgi:hypothetical protein
LRKNRPRIAFAPLYFIKAPCELIHTLIAFRTA